jgi:hypothetical protein
MSTDQTPGGDMSDQPDTPILSDTGEDDAPPEGERRDVLDAMAVYSADGQVDDASGNDAAAGATLPRDGESDPEPDREPHGPN